MIARLLALLLLAAPSLAAAGPALVTTARGEVTVVASDQPRPAPAAPFVLQEGESLKVAEGALIVVLYEGNATQVAGPAIVDQTTLKKPAAVATAGVDVLGELLSRHVSTAPTGASRAGGDATLVRPVPGSTIATAHAIAWRCEGCGEQEVAVHDLLTGEVLWTGKGVEHTTYAGPPLAAGAYAVVLQGRDYAFTVADDAERARAEAAVEAARAAAEGLAGADAAARASVVASVWLQAGFPSDALWVIDEAARAHPADAAMAALRATFEQRAGLAP